jgi:ATP-binding cassette subfamily B (MDR/TAP) protein 1
MITPNLSLQIIFSLLAETFLTETNDSHIFLSKVNQLSTYFVYLGVAAFFANSVTTAGFIYLGHKITRRLREYYLAVLLYQNAAFFDGFGPGECAARLTSQTDTVEKAIAQKSAETLIGILRFIASFAVGFYFCWRLTLVLTWSIFVAFLVMKVVARVTTQNDKSRLDAETSAAAVLEESFTSVRDVTALGAQNYHVNRYAERLKNAEQFQFRGITILSLTLAFTVGISHLIIMTTLWAGSNFIVDLQASFEDIITIQFIIQAAIFVIIGIISTVDVFVKAKTTISAISSMRAPNVSPRTGDGPQHITGTIAFENIGYMYPSRSTSVIFDNVNLNFPAGKMTALVGRSGSGKTTVLDLIERFYDPTSGSILFDGVNSKDLDIYWLRRRLGLVSQSPVLFQGTIFDNICHGLTGTEFEKADIVTQQALVEAATQVSFSHDFIKALPNGYNTQVGDRGLKLSGGQKQRIAIARAVIAGPAVLLLDEATSALDSETEVRVLSAVKSLKCTTILVAHRLTAIKSADKIIVLSVGNSPQESTFDELCQSQNAFTDLVQKEQEITPSSTNQLTYERVLEKDHDDIKVERSISAASLNFNSTTEKHDSADPVPPSAVLDILVNQNRDQDTRSTPKSSLCRLVQFIWTFQKDRKTFLLCGILAAFVAGVEEPVHAILFAKSTVSLSLPKSMYGELLTQTRLWALMYLTLAVVQFLAFATQGLCFGALSLRVLRLARVDAMRCLLRSSIESLDQIPNLSSSLTSFVTTETSSMADLMGSTLGMLFIIAATLFVAFIVSCAFQWKLALVCWTIFPVLFGCSYLRNVCWTEFQRRRKEGYREAASYASEAIGEFRTIAALTREQHVLSLYRSLLVSAARDFVTVSIKIAGIQGLVRSITYFGLALGFWYGGTLLGRGDCTAFQFFVTYTAVMFASQSAGLIFSISQDLGIGKRAAMDLLQLFGREPLLTSQESFETESQNRIQFRDVYFQYPSRSCPALKGISFVIEPGEHVAFIGANGAGKSTILSLLERFYDPQSGIINVHGFDISTIDVENYRKTMALVSQDVVLYNATIKENLLLGTHGRVVSDEDLHSACQKANILDFISSLP